MDHADIPAPASAYVLPAAFSGEFVDKVITAESSGNPRARPCDPKTGKLLSLAYGAGQFIEATWLEMVKKYRPDLANKSEAEVLKMRGDFGLSREMTIRFAEENRTYLIKHGFDPTDAALYLAHFAGRRGAVKLLQAHRETPVEKILSPEALVANQFLTGKTPATLYAWAKKKMNIEVSPLVKQANVSTSDKVTPHGEIPGCGADTGARMTAEVEKPDVGKPKAEKPEFTKVDARMQAAETPETQPAMLPTGLGNAVRFVVGGVVKFAIRS